jgi:hypothetical protein
MKKYLLLFLLLFSLSSFASSFDFNTNCKKAYQSILCLKFDEGKLLLDAEKSKNPDNVIVYYIEDYIDFLKLAISEDSKLFSELKNNKDIRINKIEDVEEDSEYKNYCLAEINLHWAFARMKFKEYITAVSEINKAYDLLNTNKKKYPDFIPNYKGLGLLHSIIGTIPDDYEWVKKLIGISGTISQGVAELSLVLKTSLKNESYDYLKTESLFFLTFVQLNLQSNKEEALAMAKYLDEPDFAPLLKSSPLISYAAASIAIKTGNNDKAIQILESRPSGTGYYPFYYLDYLLGVAKLNRLDDNAYKYLYSFILNFKGQNYIKAAYQKIAWFYLINGNTAKYKEKIALAITMGCNTVDEDKQAMTEAKSKVVPNVSLLKARLLCDGGYYQKAMNILLEKKPSEFCFTTKDFLEYTYRIGRIYDSWEKDDSAMPYYELTIKNGSAFTFYFAANAALHLGMIYENKKNKTMAKYYYQLCTQMKNTEYKSSINQKAKAGLNRIQ